MSGRFRLFAQLGIYLGGGNPLVSRSRRVTRAVKAEDLTGEVSRLALKSATKVAAQCSVIGMSAAIVGEKLQDFFGFQSFE